MECDEMKNLILLDDAGELEREKRRVLWQHLTACATCRRFKKELKLAEDLCRLEDRSTKIKHSTIHDIKQTAQKTIEIVIEKELREQEKPWYVLEWKALLACAAVALLCFGLWWVIHWKPHRPIPQQAHGPAAIDAALAWNGDDFDVRLATARGRLSTIWRECEQDLARDRHEIDVMARELMLMDGGEQE